MGDTAPETPVPSGEITFMDRDEFLREHVGGRTDRELLIECLYGQHRVAVAVANLHALVQRIETEANETINSFGSPDALMAQARKFLG